MAQIKLLFKDLGGTVVQTVAQVRGIEETISARLKKQCQAFLDRRPE